MLNILYPRCARARGFVCAVKTLFFDECAFVSAVESCRKLDPRTFFAHALCRATPRRIMHANAPFLHTHCGATRDNARERTLEDKGMGGRAGGRVKAGGVLLDNLNDWFQQDQYVS